MLPPIIDPDGGTEVPIAAAPELSVTNADDAQELKTVLNVSQNDSIWPSMISSFCGGISVDVCPLYVLIVVTLHFATSCCFREVNAGLLLTP